MKYDEKSNTGIALLNTNRVEVVSFGECGEGTLNVDVYKPTSDDDICELMLYLKYGNYNEPFCKDESECQMYTEGKDPQYSFYTNKCEYQLLLSDDIPVDCVEIENLFKNLLKDDLYTVLSSIGKFVKREYGNDICDPCYNLPGLAIEINEALAANGRKKFILISTYDRENTIACFKSKEEAVLSLRKDYESYILAHNLSEEQENCHINDDGTVAWANSNDGCNMDWEIFEV